MNNFFLTQLWFTYLRVLCVGACCSLLNAEAPSGAAYSRSVILPLVSNPGKQKGLFSSFRHGENATWNKNFWGASLGFEQFSGVSWGNPRAGTLISPEHVVSAAHYGLNKKGFHFTGPDGKYLGSRKAARDKKNKPLTKKVNPDILITKLDTPAPVGAFIYTLPDSSTYAQRLAWASLPKNQRPILVATDYRNPRPDAPAGAQGHKRWRTTRSAHPVLFSRLFETSRSIHWGFGKWGESAVHPSYHETVNLGDSGNPLFWVTPRGLVLASHFTGVGSGPDYGHPDVQKELQAAIDQLGGQKPYKLKFAPVP